MDDFGKPLIKFSFPSFALWIKLTDTPPSPLPQVDFSQFSSPFDRIESAAFFPLLLGMENSDKKQK